MWIYIPKQSENPDLDIANPDLGSKSLAKGVYRDGLAGIGMPVVLALVC